MVALIVYTYVSIHQNRYFLYAPGIVTDSWTGISYEGKLINSVGSEIKWPFGSVDIGQFGPVTVLPNNEPVQMNNPNLEEFDE